MTRASMEREAGGPQEVGAEVADRGGLLVAARPEVAQPVRVRALLHGGFEGTTGARGGTPREAKKAGDPEVARCRAFGRGNATDYPRRDPGVARAAGAPPSVPGRAERG